MNRASERRVFARHEKHSRMWLLASSACFYSNRISSLGSPYALKAVRYSARMLLVEPDQQLLTFADLDISAGLRQNIAALGHRTATLVQTASLPALLAGEDVVAKARTGTGKTLAFLIPTIERLMISEVASPDQIRALVLSPALRPALTLALALARSMHTHLCFLHIHVHKFCVCTHICVCTHFGFSL
jgi:hypothetical protein